MMIETLNLLAQRGRKPALNENLIELIVLVAVFVVAALAKAFSKAKGSARQKSSPAKRPSPFDEDFWQVLEESARSESEPPPPPTRQPRPSAGRPTAPAQPRAGQPRPPLVKPAQPRPRRPAQVRTPTVGARRTAIPARPARPARAQQRRAARPKPSRRVRMPPPPKPPPRPGEVEHEGQRRLGKAVHPVLPSKLAPKAAGAPGAVSPGPAEALPLGHDDLRRAILYREILGPPRALEPYD